ncbi:hypothetical protein [Psychrobacillus sp. FSL K6-1464]|uniref:hypothetical protein n=1 Tax=Psychrobacillus sp. FSL K6-1464 TaxID=2921545 RepID=UPI0030F934CF
MNTPNALILPPAKTDIPTSIKSGDADVKTEIKNVDVGAKGTDNPRTRLPRNNGHWGGEPGNGKWYSDKPEVISITNGEGVEFAKSRPNFTPWSEGNIVFEKGKLTGSNDDFSIVYEKIQHGNVPHIGSASDLRGGY